MENQITSHISADRALLPEGWARDARVAVGADGRVKSVETGRDAATSDIRVPILLPALSNLHSHSFQRAMAGLAEARGPSGRDSFWTWREIMYRFLDLLTPEDVEPIAAMTFMEMLESGFAAVAEFHYLHNCPGGAAYDDPGELATQIAAAATRTGIGLTLLPVHYAQGGVDGRPIAGGQSRFANDIDGFARLVERSAEIVDTLADDAGWGVAPHSLRAVTRRDLAVLAELAIDRPIHMHIAEQEAEVEETLAVFGKRPVAWLLDNMEVDGRWCLIHCTHMTEQETAGLAASGAVAGLCPITEANLGDGIFEGADFLSEGGSFGVGTDSNISIGAAEELCQLEYSQRLRDRGRVVLAVENGSAGRLLYEGALAGGARALGRESGLIAPGKLADLVALDMEDSGLDMLQGDRILDGWIFCGGRRQVRHLWSAGRHVVINGRHRDREAIILRYRKRLGDIMERL